MVNKSDLLRMQEFGEWLEKIFNSDIHSWEFRELAEYAINLLSLDYKIKDDDPFLFVAMNREAERKEGESFFTEPAFSESILNQIADSERIKFIINFPPDPDIDPESYKEWSPPSREETKKAENIITFAFNFLSLPEIIDNSIKALKAIASSPEVPWEKSDVVQGRIIIRQPTTPSLFTAYSKITTALKITPGGVKKVNIFTNGDFLWTPVLSHIFFNFLFLGGQNYFGFCQHCDRFFVSQRKGRKKFCSDKCRLDHFRS